MASVFIGSTSLDLSAYRAAAIEVCLRLELLPIAMEHFEATGSGATSGSIRKLDEADVYVGIYAHRYGYVPPSQTASVTELEFDRAGAHGIERLCFLIAPNFPWPPDTTDQTQRDQLRRFKERIKQT